MCKVCYARILDSKRKFLEAGTRYYQLSQLQGKSFGALTVSEAELTQALLQAVTCAILAPAGPQRSRPRKKKGEEKKARKRAGRAETLRTPLHITLNKRRARGNV